MSLLQTQSPAHVEPEAERRRQELIAKRERGEGYLSYGQWVHVNPASADLWQQAELRRWDEFKVVCEAIVKCAYQQRHYAFQRYHDADGIPYVPRDPDDPAKALDHGISEQILFDVLYGAPINV